MSRVLYIGNKNASSWAFRAWLALKEQNIDFDEVLVDIRRPQRWQNLAQLGEFAPPASVPVLVDRESVIFDSLAIMEYAHDIGDGSLFPANPMAAAETRSWLAWQHAGLHKVCPCLSFESVFYPQKRSLSQDEIKSAEDLYLWWEKALCKSGGEYLFGDLSVADLALVPTVLRLTSHHSIAAHWPNARYWAERLINRPHVQQWLSSARAEAPIYLPGYYGDS